MKFFAALKGIMKTMIVGAACHGVLPEKIASQMICKFGLVHV